MKMVKTAILVVLTGVFFFSAVDSASANPAVKHGFKLVFNQFGRKAAAEAMEKALKESGGRITREALERIGMEAAERAVGKVAPAVIREAMEMGARQAGARLPHTLMREAFLESNEAATRLLLSRAAKEVVEEAAEAVLHNGMVTISVTSRTGIIRFLSNIDEGGKLIFSSNPADAIVLTRTAGERVAARIQRNMWESSTMLNALIP